MSDTLYMVWRDTDKKYPLGSKMIDAIDQYRVTRKQEPNVVLLSVQDFREIGTVPLSSVVIRERSDIQRNHFYVGVE